MLDFGLNKVILGQIFFSILQIFLFFVLKNLILGKDLTKGLKKYTRHDIYLLEIYLILPTIPYFTYYYVLFYGKNGKKKIPENIIDLLTDGRGDLYII